MRIIVKYIPYVEQSSLDNQLLETVRQYPHPDIKQKQNKAYRWWDLLHNIISFILSINH